MEQRHCHNPPCFKEPPCAHYGGIGDALIAFVLTACLFFSAAFLSAPIHYAIGLAGNAIKGTGAEAPKDAGDWRETGDYPGKGQLVPPDWNTGGLQDGD